MVASQHAQRLFLVQGSHPFFGRPFSLPTCSALYNGIVPRSRTSTCTHPQRIAPRLHARTHARTRTHGRPTNERFDVRSAGVADWNTSRGGGTERTLTAAAGPSPRDPHRHALAMRPPRKVRPFFFLGGHRRGPAGENPPQPTATHHNPPQPTTTHRNPLKPTETHQNSLKITETH